MLSTISIGRLRWGQVFWIMKNMECLGHKRQGRVKVVNSEGGTPAQSKGKQPGQG